MVFSCYLHLSPFTASHIMSQSFCHVNVESHIEKTENRKYKLKLVLLGGKDRYGMFVIFNFDIVN